MVTTKIAQNKIHVSKRASTTLCIKNMVSLRCKLVVKSVLERLELEFSYLEIGSVVITDNFPQKKSESLKPNY